MAPKPRSLFVVLRRGSARLSRSTVYMSFVLFALSLIVVAAHGEVRQLNPLSWAFCPGPEGGTMLGWVNTEFLSMLPLIGGLYAVVAVAWIVAGPMGGGALELVLAQPIKRETYLLGKFLAVVKAIIYFHLASFLGLTVGFLFVGYSPAWMAYLSLFTHSLVMVLTVAALAQVIAVVMGNVVQAITYGVGLVLVFFVFDILLRTEGGLEGWRMMTPFGCYSGCEILAGSAVLAYSLGCLVGWGALMLTLSVHIFVHKDLD